MKLQNQVALVTGAGNLKGIGRGIACALAQEGADIAVNYVVNPQEAGQVAEIIRGYGRRALLVKADISQPEQVQQMYAGIEAYFGRLDILVNNAGVCVWEPFLEISKPAFDHAVNINIKGTWECARLAARYMVEKGIHGRIINVASGHARRPMPLMGIYAATKAAIDQMSQSMAFELARYGITVNQLWPGFVDTNINDPKPELATIEGRKKLLATIPIGKPATIEELGAAAVYLCSEAGGVVTGDFIKIDGGQHIRCI